MIIETNISKELINRAEERIDSLNFNRTEMSKFGSDKKRTLIGYIGEYMVMDFLDVKNEIDDFDYDIIYNGMKVEIKTISCKFKPFSHYLCTVNSHSLHGIHKQNADYYIFTRIINDLSKGWILGFIKCTDFFKRGKFNKKGSNIVSGITFSKANATTLPIYKLDSIKKMLKTKKGEVMEYDNTNKGALFINDKKDKDNPEDRHPDMTGKVNVDGADFFISAWKRKGKESGKPFLSLSIKLADNLKTPKKDDDELPF